MTVGKVIRKRATSAHQLQQWESNRHPQGSPVHMAARSSKRTEALGHGDGPAERRIHHRTKDSRQ